MMSTYFRQSLKKMVNWEACGCEIAGEASNGEDGLVLAQKADIALQKQGMKMLIISANVSKNMSGFHPHPILKIRNKKLMLKKCGSGMPEHIYI